MQPILATYQIPTLLSSLQVLSSMEPFFFHLNRWRMDAYLISSCSKGLYTPVTDLGHWKKTTARAYLRKDRLVHFGIQSCSYPLFEANPPRCKRSLDG